MWPEAWGVRMEHILRNVLMALLEQPAATMHDILRVFSDAAFRKEVARSFSLVLSFRSCAGYYPAPGSQPQYPKFRRIATVLHPPTLSLLRSARLWAPPPKDFAQT